MQSKNLFIMRGTPGSGKSYVAELLAPSHVYASDDHPGLYGDDMSFNRELLGDAHRGAQSRAIEAMKTGAKNIAIANTNTQHWEMAPYIKAAKSFGYYVTFVHIEGTITPDDTMTSNVHKVPVEAIKRMSERFEPFDFNRRNEAQKLINNSIPINVSPDKKSTIFNLNLLK